MNQTRTTSRRSKLAWLAAFTLFVAVRSFAQEPISVQVVNTTANPVPNLDTERNVCIPYQSTGTNTAFFAGLQQLGLGFATVPAGYRQVAQMSPPR